jgi:hypothetical protein
VLLKPFGDRPDHFGDLLERPFIFKPGSEQDSCLSSSNSGSALLAWFKLNQNDINANPYLYHNIPNYYTFYNKKWSLRKRNGKKVTYIFFN